MKSRQLKGWVGLEKMKFHANHGVHQDEKINGGSFQIDLFIKTDLFPAANSDDLNKAVDYESISRIASEEMKKPSSLLEHVANRILERILEQQPSVIKAKIKISKLNPPVGVPCYASVVKMKMKQQ